MPRRKFCAQAMFALMFGFWAHFLLRKKPGFPLQ
jgi:hypothetical protein